MSKLGQSLKCSLGAMALMSSTMLGCETGEGVETAELAFETICNNVEQFTQGCRIDFARDRWSPAFVEYADANDIFRTGAQVRFFPRGANPFEKVAYVIGPHLETREFDTPNQEIVFLQETLSPILSRARAQFDAQGVSMLYIGFGHAENSKQPIEHRVAMTKWALQRFKTIRHQNLDGAHAPDALLMGFSLGGVVGKIALADLEVSATQRGEPAENGHDVGTYISLDAPHQGAMTPLAFQYLPIFIKNALEKFKSKVGGGLNGLLVDFVEIFKDLKLDRLDGSIGLTNDVIKMGLKSPLAQDLLITNLAYEDNKSPNISYLKNRSNLPTTTYNVAASSGATNGKELELGDTFFTFDTGEGPSDLQFQITAKTPTVAEPEFFWGRLRYRKSPLQWKDSKYTRSRWTYPYDIKLERGSCGWQRMLPRATKAELESAFRNVWGNFTIEVEEERNCFIPTYSAINSRGGVYSTSASSNFDVIIPNSYNFPHLSFSASAMNSIVLVIRDHFASVD